LLAGLLGLLDQGAGLGELAVMLGQELGGGDENRAAQAGVGVFTVLLQREGAVSVRQCHLRSGQVILHPDSLGQRPGVRGELLAALATLSEMNCHPDWAARTAGSSSASGRP